MLGKGDYIYYHVIMEIYVRLPDNMWGIVTEGTVITNIEVFAGYGAVTELRKRYYIAENYGGNSEKWQHSRGNAYIDGVGKKSYIKARLAEVHWFEKPDAKLIKEMRVVRWLPEQE